MDFLSLSIFILTFAHLHTDQVFSLLLFPIPIILLDYYGPITAEYILYLEVMEL